MPLKAVLENLEGLDESLKSAYQEKDGKYVLDVEGIDDHPSVRGVVTANRENRRKRDELRAELDQFKSRYEGLPDDFSLEMFEDLQARAKGDKVTDEKLNEMREALRSRLEKDYGKKLEPITAENEALKQSIERMTVRDGLSKAMDEAGIDPIHKNKLVPYLRSSAKISVEREDNGDFKASVDTDIGPMSLDKFVKDWAASDDGKVYLAKPTGPGPKGRGHNVTGKTVRRGDFERLDPVSKSQMMREGVQVVD